MTNRFIIPRALGLIAVLCNSACAEPKPPLAVAPPTTPALATNGDEELDPASISRVVVGRIDEVRACYEAQLAKDPNIAGTVEVEFEITTDGHVGEASIVRDLAAAPEVGTCMVQVIKAWRFAAPNGGSVWVNFPFVFSSSDAAQDVP